MSGGKQASGALMPATIKPGEVTLRAGEIAVDVGHASLGDLSARRYVPELTEVAISRNKADIAARTLRIVQIAVKVREFQTAWHGGVGRPNAEHANFMLVRRLWVHCLLANAWLSVNDLERITGRDHRTIESDRDVVSEWAEASAEFHDVVMLCEEAVDACVTLMASRDRLFRVASLASTEARRARSIERERRARLLSPRPVGAGTLKEK